MNVLLLLMALALSSNISANQNLIDDTLDQPEEAPKLREIQEYSATSSEIKSTMCRQDISIQRYLESIMNKHDRWAKRGNRTIGGIHFHNQPLGLLNHFKTLTSAVPLSLNQRRTEFLTLAPGWEKDLQRERNLFFEKYVDSLLIDIHGNSRQLNPPVQIDDLTKMVKENCHDVFCAMKGVFGERWDELIILSVVYNLNASELSGHLSVGNQHVSPWTEKELHHILSALENMPYFSTKNVFMGSTISRLDRDPLLRINNSTKIGNATLIFYNEMDNLTPEQKEYIMFHEFAHLISEERLTSSEIREWKKISHWKRRREEGAPSLYATISWNEDLAESIAAYRYTGKILKQRSIERYNFLKKNIFAGEEFITQEDCDNFRSFGFYRL